MIIHCTEPVKSSKQDLPNEDTILNQPLCSLVNTLVLVSVKTQTRTHNNEYGQVPMVTDLHMWPVISFLCLGTEAGGVYKRTLGAEIRHPHLATGWASVLTWGEIIRSCSGWPPLASKTARLGEKQLYYVVAHHAQVGVLRKNLSTEHGETPHWD